MNMNLLSKSLAIFLKNHSDESEVTMRDVSCDQFLSSVSISMKMNGESVTSYGQGFSRGEATFKALMESVERYVLLTRSVDQFSNYASLFGWPQNADQLMALFPNSRSWIPDNSNGVSAHTSLRLAKEGAIDELVERHVVLKAHALKMSPAIVSPPLVTENSGSQLPSAQFFTWRGPVNRFVVLASGEFNNHRVFGFGSHVSLEKAKEKAFLEIFPRLEILSKSRNQDLRVMALNKNFLFHWYEKSKEVSILLDRANSSIPIVDGDICKKDVWIGKFQMPKELEQLGVSVVRAVSPKMQALFSGQWDRKKLNPVAFPKKMDMPKEYHLIG